MVFCVVFPIENRNSECSKADYLIKHFLGLYYENIF